MKKKRGNPNWKKGKSGNPATMWKQGESGNKDGKHRSAGASIQENINSMAAAGLTESQLKTIARSKVRKWTERAAAERILRTLEVADLADFEDVMNGISDLTSARQSGLNTEVVKKLKTKTRTIPSKDGDHVTEVEREIELHDRAGDDFDRVMDRTMGRPTQAIEHSGPDGGPIETEAGNLDMSKLSFEELEYLQNLKNEVLKRGSGDNEKEANGTHENEEGKHSTE